MQTEYQLRTEIEFWRDMIETPPRAAEPDTMERVRNAKSLAEKKLELLLNEAGAMLN